MRDRRRKAGQRVLRVVATGVLWVSGAVLATDAPSPAVQPPPARPGPAIGGLVAGGTEPNLFLVSSGDVIGYLDPCG